MIDYLIRHDTEADAVENPALAEWSNFGYWEGNVLPGVTAYYSRGWETIIAPWGPYESEMKDIQPGWYLILALGERDLTLEGDDCAMLAKVRETGEIVFTRYSPEDAAALKIEPVFAGMRRAPE